MPRFIDFFVTERQGEIWCDIGVYVPVEIHRQTILCPDDGEEVETALHGVWCFADTCFVGVFAVVERLSPMGSTIEITVLNSLVDTCLMPHLDDVDFATTRPDTASFACELFRLGIHVIVVAEVGSEVVAKHPESRPQAIGGVGECDTRFNLSVLDSDLVLCI